MDSGKGKGRAPLERDEGKSQSKPEDSSANPSMLSRVAASASGLTRSALGAPSSNELNQTAAAALSRSGKGSSSGNASGSSASAESSKTAQQPTLPQLDGPARERFRVGHSEEHADQSEREFSAFLDRIDAFSASEPSAPLDHEDYTLAEAWTRSQSPKKTQASIPPNTSVTEQQSRDGEEVLAMLSDPNYSLEEQFEAPEPEEENYDWGLSGEQITQLRAMTKHMFPAPEPHAAVDLDHPLNLIPSARFGQEVQGTTLEETREWREQWNGVLTRYADEVWGGLLPLVKEARQEVEDMKQGSEGSEQPTALRRLGAILGHLQKR
jgi:hypothetical protein